MILSSCLTAVVLASSLALTGPVPEETVVDDPVVEQVPADTRMSTFDFEFDDVTFRSQVWERGPDAEGAHAVDLTVKVLRGERLTDLAATRTFLAGYHEQDATAWIPFDHHGEPGYRRPGAVFWWAGTGTAVEVSMDESRFGVDELTATALGVRLPAPRQDLSRESPTGLGPPDRP